MVEGQALNCYSGKKIPCEIDSVCVHGDGKSAVNTAKRIKEGLIKSGIILKPLNQLKKFSKLESKLYFKYELLFSFLENCVPIIDEIDL